MGAPPPNLLPAPLKRRSLPGHWRFRERMGFCCVGAPQHFERARLALDAPTARPWPRSDFHPAAGPDQAQLLLEHCAAARHGSLPPGLADSPEAYHLNITPELIHLTAHHSLGLLQGVRTLRQWLAGAWSGAGAAPGALPCEQIEDAPAIRRRGVMLDISRDRVPRLDFLRGWVEQLAALKVNELQLYTEHTFAYAGHEEVWQSSDPITPGELTGLAAFCHERGIDLVPNQQSLGHMHRWLRHASYRHLAERPDGIEHPFSSAREPYGLAIDCKATLPFLSDLYGQVLPHCLPPVAGPVGSLPNGFLSVGLDEAEDLGSGRSAALLGRLGRRRLFSGHLRNVARLAAEHGRAVQFWADELLRDELPLPAIGSGSSTDPDAASGAPDARLAADQPPGIAPPGIVPSGAVPPGAVPLIWGYEADHPWERACAPLSGTDFYICPGTSSWNSFLGRPLNARGNLTGGAAAAVSFGAAGFLITDWGDRGHHQPPTVSDAPLALGLALAWNPAAPPQDADLHAHLDREYYGTPGLAAAVEACGLAVEAPGVGTVNENPPSAILRYANSPLPNPRLPGLTITALEHSLGELGEARAHLEALPCPTPQGTLARAEVAWAARLADACLHLGLARLVAGGRPLAGLSAPERQTLARRLAPCLDEHGPLWRARSREGGRADSLGRLLELCAGLGPALSAARANQPDPAATGIQ